MSKVNEKTTQEKTTFSDSDTLKEHQKNLTLSIDAALMNASNEKFRLLLERLATMLPREEFIETLQVLSTGNDLTEDADFNPLTTKEEEIIIRLAQGQRNRQIAEELFISSHTVRTHRNNIHRKLKIIGRCANPVIYYKNYVVQKMKKK